MICECRFSFTNNYTWFYHEWRMCRDYVFFFHRTKKRKTSCIQRFCLNKYEFHENIMNFMHILKLSLISLKKHDRRIRHDNIRHIRHIRYHSKNIYIFFASIRFARFFAVRLFVMYNRSKIMWYWAIARNCSSFDMRFEFAVASQTTKRARAKSETRLRCDSKEEKKDRIRRRSKEKEIAFDDVRKRERTIAFDDVVVVDSKTQRMTRNSNCWFVCERIRLRRRRRLHV